MIAHLKKVGRQNLELFIQIKMFFIRTQIVNSINIKKENSNSASLGSLGIEGAVTEKAKKKLAKKKAQKNASKKASQGGQFFY
jgi:hypothetical protein